MNTSLRIWHPFTNALLDPAPLRVASAEGVYLHLADGRRILDAISSWWVNLHGHANPRISAAVAEQSRKLEHVILAGFTHDPAEELAARLRKWAPAELTHMFLSDDGSTAVEVALKLAVQHFQNLARPEKHEIVALADGYHGDTAGAMSVSDSSPFTAPFDSMRYPVHRVHSAYCYRCPVGLKRESCHIECVQKLEDLLAERGDKIAAVIVEPLLQGVGGMIVHPVEFLQKIRALCTRHDVLSDCRRSAHRIRPHGENVCLRTGERCARPDVPFQRHHGRIPDHGRDVVHGSRGVRVSQRKPHAHFPPRPFLHGECAGLRGRQCQPADIRGRASIRPIAAISRVNADRLADLRGMHQVGDTRHIGTVGALELRADDPGYLSALRPKLYDFFLRRGVLLRPLGNVIYVIPPYVITREELHHVYDIITEAIEALV